MIFPFTDVLAFFIQMKYRVLYTHQKTKKAKIWQVNIMVVYIDGNNVAIESCNQMQPLNQIIQLNVIIESSRLYKCTTI